MRFVMVTQHYPVEGDPIFVFSQQIAEAMAGYHDIDTVVISPQSITRKLIHRKRITKSVYSKILDNGKKVTVYAYPCLTFSGASNGVLNSIQTKSYDKALKKCIRAASIGKDDFCYAMFWGMGRKLDKALTALNIDTNIIVESSESELQNGEEISDHDFKNLRGIVCVSSEKVNECNKYGLLEKAPHALVPNGFDANVFRKLNRIEMRKKLNLPADKYIIIFVGSFIKRKGITELINALKGLDDVFSIFIGSGPIVPDCPNILFSGSLDHYRIPEYLSAADVFVLPTKHEGCANVIVEALGCGLPVISSDKDFNKEILDDKCAILIDPDNEVELKQAIVRLRDDKGLRESMTIASSEKAKELTIENRTKRILGFIEEVMKQ